MVPPLVLRWDIRPREINLILRLPPPALRHHLPRPRIILHLQMNHGSSNSNYCSSSSNSNNNNNKYYSSSNNSSSSSTVYNRRRVPLPMPNLPISR